MYNKPISTLKKELENKFGSEWFYLEIETILLEFGENSSDLLFDELLRDKINVLKVVSHNPDKFYINPLFFIHASEVMNNNVTDFTSIPMLTSIEAAFAIIDMSKVLGVELNNSPHFNNGVRMVIKYILDNDGYSEVVYPFDIVGITGLTAGQHTIDTENKKKAIDQYVTAMYS
jgi:hypothetical protein